MAINLWKIGGQPTSFSSLPNGWVNFIWLNPMDIKVRFKASSPSSKRLAIKDGTVVFNLTPVHTQYEYTFTYTSYSKFFFYNQDSNSDVTVTDIELVQKPLSKLTINGISGEVTDWESGSYGGDNTLIVDPARVRYKTDIPLVKNTNYSINVSSDYEVFYRAFDSSNTQVSFSSVWGLSVSFNSGTAVKARIIVRRKDGANLSFAEIINAKPMLNMGSIPAPYEKKKGERMVMPVAKKNLFDGVFEAGAISTTNGVDNTVSDRIRSKNYIVVKPLTDYVISNNKGYTNPYVCYYDINKAFISFESGKNTYKMPSNCYFVKFVYVSIGSDLTTIAQLEQGTTPTAYEPYAVQVNKKPMRYVPKKNMISDDWVQGSKSTTRVNNNSTVRITLNSFPKIQGGKTFILSAKSGYKFGLMIYDGTGANLHDSGWQTSKYTYTTPSNAVDFSVNIAKMDDSTIAPSEVVYIQPQIEEGTTATPYEKYQLVLPKAKTGLVMDGVNNYVQLPSMTMDAIEIECLIDAVQNNYATLIDARTGLANGWCNVTEGMGVGWSDFLVNGVSKSKTTANIIRNERAKIKFVAVNSFTDNVNVFSTSTGTGNLKGILYKVTCYLAGQVVATYDFENPSNLVADKLIPNARNLIPSFEDAKWSLHPNFRVLGRDVGRLDATASNNGSYVFIPCLPNKQYLVTFNGNGKLVVENFTDNNTGYINAALIYVSKGVYTFTTHANANYIKYWLHNNAVAGSFDFIRPQLYALDGKEATLYGTPLKTKKQPKRTLYAKR